MKKDADLAKRFRKIVRIDACDLGGHLIETTVFDSVLASELPSLAVPSVFR